MTELKTHTEDDADFLKKSRDAARRTALQIGTGVVAVGAIGGAAFGFSEAQSQQQHHAPEEAAHNQTLEVQTNEDIIEKSISARYDEKQVVGEFTLEEGSDLIGSTVAVVKSHFGETEFKNLSSRIYNPLIDSATAQGIVQPGETFSVVSTDIDPNQKNGDELIVVKSDNIDRPQAEAIPTPTFEN